MKKNSGSGGTEHPDATPKKHTGLDGTVVKGFALIEFLASNELPVGVSAIAQHFNWQKSNVHRLLTTLKALGYVRQDSSTSRYELSLKTWELGMKVVGRSMIKRCAQPFMSALNRQFQESVNLSILVGSDILYLDNVMSSYPLRPTASPGSRVPAIFTASGKCLLAYREDASSLAQSIIAVHPEAVNMSLPKLMSELDNIRKSGYAVSLSGWRKNVNSISAVIQNRAGVSFAAVGISGPSERMPEEKIREMIPAVLHAAAQIAETSGGGAVSA